MLTNSLVKIFDKNKIKRLRRRLKWRKPSFFFTNKTFGKINQRKRWMAFKNLRLFRRHLILNNKYLLKYMVFLHQFKNIYKPVINKYSQNFLTKKISTNLIFLKRYLFVKNKQINSIKKKNYTFVFISNWFFNKQNKKNKNQLKMYKYRYTKVIKKYNTNIKYKKTNIKNYKTSLKTRIKNNNIKTLKKILSKLTGWQVFTRKKQVYKLNPKYKWNYKHYNKNWRKPNYQYSKFIKKIKRIKYYKIPKKYFAKWCRYLKTHLFKYYSSSVYNLYLQKYYNFLVTPKYFQYKFRFITTKELYNFYKLLAQIAKTNANKTIRFIQHDILNIIGFIKLKNFTFSTRLRQIVNFLLNNIFRKSLIKYQFKKYDKFLFNFIKNLNSNTSLLNNKKSKLNKNLIYISKILLYIKHQPSMNKTIQNRKHLALRLLRINRKHFKLNITQIKKSGIISAQISKKHLKKNNKKKLHWFDRAKYLDRQKKRLKYKQKSKSFSYYQDLFLKNTYQLYYKRFYNKKYNNFSRLNRMYYQNNKKFKNIQLSKTLQPIISNNIFAYKLHKNTNKIKKNFFINSLYQTTIRKTLLQNINKYPFTKKFSNKTLYFITTSQLNNNFHLNQFNYFILKAHQKQNHYTKKTKVKLQKLKPYFIKKNFNFKQLFQVKPITKQILYTNKKKFNWLKRTQRWNKKKLLRNRRFYLNWRKIKLRKRKKLFNKNNKKTLKTFFIKNILNRQYQNLIITPKPSLKYIKLFKELFYERWLLGTYKKKAQIEPLFNFLIKKHSKFLQTFYLNPFIYLKQAQKNYYLKFKKYCLLLKNCTKKINKLKKVTEKNIKKTQPIKKLNLLQKLHKEIKNKIYSTIKLNKLVKKHSFYFSKFNKLEQTLASSTTDMTRLKRQAFTTIKTIKGLYKNFTNFFRYNIISTKQRNYFNKKIFINFLLNNYKTLSINQNKLLYLINTLKINTRKSLLKKTTQNYFKTDLPKRIQTEYLKKRKRLNRYRSYQLYSKYRFNKRLFLNRNSRLRFGLTHFLRKWKRVQNIYSQKKFIVKFFLQQYYKGLNPTEFYKMKNKIKYKSNKLTHWHKQIENRADIILSKTKLTSNLWLSRYLLTSKKIFFDNKLHTKTNTIFNNTPIITTNTQIDNDLFYNIYQNHNKTIYKYNVTLPFYQKTADTENFLNLTTNRKLKRYTHTTITNLNSNIFKTYKNILNKKTLKFKRPLTFEKRKRRLFFFNKKQLIKKYKNLKKTNQSDFSDLTNTKVSKRLRRNLPKFLLYRTNRNNKGPFANLVQHNKYKTIYFNNWYTNYLTNIQTQFTIYNGKNLKTTKNINNLFSNNFISNKLTTTNTFFTNYNQIKHAPNLTTTIFNTTKTITNSIINNHFSTWRRTFEFKLHRRFKRRGRKRPRVLRTKFTKTRNNTLLTYDFLNFLRFNKI